MFYIEQDDKIILADGNLQRLKTTLKFKPELADCEIKETDKQHTVVEFQLFTLERKAEIDNEAKSAEIRAERDRRIDAIRWRIERYQTQLAAGLETTDTAEQYQALLMYVQALRDVPEQAGFPNIIEWPVIEEKTENTKDTEEPDITPESEATEETA